MRVRFITIGNEKCFVNMCGLSLARPKEDKRDKLTGRWVTRATAFEAAPLIRPPALREVSDFSLTKRSVSHLEI